MDPRLLKYYNQELQFLRESGGEFAKDYPKIAARLGLDGFECADPYVERLLEGFAFLTARVQLKLDAQFPRFTQNLLQTVFPNYIAPTPSMLVAQMHPDSGEGSLADGVKVPRGSSLKSQVGKGDQTACDYRTSQHVTLWPLEVAEAEYFRYTGAVASVDIPPIDGVKAGIRIRLKTTAGLTFNRLSLNSLRFYLRGLDEIPMHLYEQFLGNCLGFVARPTKLPAKWHVVGKKDGVKRVGFSNDEAMLPAKPSGFSGHRLLHEYFAFPSRFMFVDVEGLRPAAAQCDDTEIDLLILFDRSNPALEGKVEADQFLLHCTPAINLFPKKADRIHLNDKDYQYHVLPDRTRPMDYEVYDVTGVTGYGSGAEKEQTFLPFYAVRDMNNFLDHRAFFCIHREPRQLSAKQKASGPRSSYVGSEVYLSLVDSREAPFRSDLRQLATNTYCTNRDLPLQMPVGIGRTDFTMGAGAPVDSVRVVSGPTRPRTPFAFGEQGWRLVSHLSLNYMSLVDNDEVQGAAALRQLLGLYGDVSEAATRKQVEGLKSVQAAPITRRLMSDFGVSYARGMEVTVNLDEAAFEGSGVFLLGAVLDEFFSRYVAINSFTETVIRTLDRGEVARWPARIGKQTIL